MDLVEFLVRHKRMADEWAERLFADVSAEQAFASPLRGVNPIFWLGGHLATADDWLLQALHGSGTTVLPAGFVRDFAPGATLREDPRSYPPWDEIKEFRGRVFRQLHEQLATLRTEELDAPTQVPPPPVASTLTSKRRALAGMTSHTFYHIGQISILRKALNLPRSL